MPPLTPRLALGVLLIAAHLCVTAAAPPAAPDPLRHSLLVFGQRTAVISEEGEVTWEYRGGSRDGMQLVPGRYLVAWSDRVEEVTAGREVVARYSLGAPNREIATAWRQPDGRTLVAEMGPEPRLVILDTNFVALHRVPLQPETDDPHMQTRMARQLPNGHYLVPHLLAFSVKEYTPAGEVVKVLRTDLAELGGRPAENWPFTAIRLPDGNTLVALTHGNKVVEFTPAGTVAWKHDNEAAGGLLRDPCGVQRLANGNTVIGSHGAQQGVSMIEVTREGKQVWSTDHPAAAAVHHFQVLTTNGRPEPPPARR